MKKKLIFAAVAAIALIIGVSGVHLQEATPTTNTLALTNVEALSRWVFPHSFDDMWYITYYDGWHHCECDGPDDCPGI